MSQVESNLSYGHLHGVVDGAQPTDLPGNGVTGLTTPTDGVVPKVASQQVDGDDAASPSVDIFINNVVCTFSVRCHLNLHRIGLEGHNVEYRKEYGVS